MEKQRQEAVATSWTRPVTFEERLHHLADQMIVIDLDDGVKANYAKFQDVLAKVK